MPSPDTPLLRIPDLLRAPNPLTTNVPLSSAPLQAPAAPAVVAPAVVAPAAMAPFNPATVVAPAVPVTNLNPLVVGGQTVNPMFPEQVQRAVNAQQQNELQALNAAFNRLQAAREERVQAEAEAPLGDRTKAQVLGDTLLGLGAGAGAFVEALGALGGAALPAVSVDNPLTRTGRSVRTAFEGEQSVQLQQKREALRAKMAEAESFGDELATGMVGVLTSPALLGDFVASNIAGLGVGGLAGRIAGKAALRGVVKAAARKAEERVARGAGARLTSEGIQNRLAAKQAELAAEISAKYGIRGAVATAALQQTGDVASGTYYDTFANTKWAEVPEYMTRVAAGEDAEEVKADLSDTAATAAAAAALPMSLATMMLPGSRLIETSLLSRAQRQVLVNSGQRAAALVKGGRVGRALRAGAGEAVSEGAEEGSGAFAGNLGQRLVDPNASLSEGIGAATGIGATVGGLLGGGVSALSPSAAPATPPPLDLPGQDGETADGTQTDDAGGFSGIDLSSLDLARRNFHVRALSDRVAALNGALEDAGILDVDENGDVMPKTPYAITLQDVLQNADVMQQFFLDSGFLADRNVKSRFDALQRSVADARSELETGLTVSNRDELRVKEQIARERREAADTRQQTREARERTKAAQAALLAAQASGATDVVAARLRELRVAQAAEQELAAIEAERRARTPVQQEFNLRGGEAIAPAQTLSPDLVTEEEADETRNLSEQRTRNIALSVLQDNLAEAENEVSVLDAGNPNDTLSRLTPRQHMERLANIAGNPLDQRASRARAVVKRLLPQFAQAYTPLEAEILRNRAGLAPAPGGRLVQPADLSQEADPLQQAVAENADPLRVRTLQGTEWRVSKRDLNRRGRPITTNPKGDAPASLRAGGVVENGLAERAARLQRIADKITARWKGMVSARVQVVEQVTDLPQNLRDMFVARGIPLTDVQALADTPNRTVYLVASHSGLKTADDVRRAVFHELWGHVGFRMAFGAKGWRVRAKALVDAFGGVDAMLAWGQERGIDLSLYGRPAPDATEQERLQWTLSMADEIAAHWVGEHPSASPGMTARIREYVVALRDTLRSLAKAIGWNFAQSSAGQDSLILLARDARRAVVEGRGYVVDSGTPNEFDVAPALVDEYAVFEENRRRNVAAARYGDHDTDATTDREQAADAVRKGAELASYDGQRVVDGEMRTVMLIPFQNGEAWNYVLHERDAEGNTLLTQVFDSSSEALDWAAANLQYGVLKRRQRVPLTAKVSIPADVVSRASPFARAAARFVSNTFGLSSGDQNKRVMERSVVNLLEAAKTITATNAAVLDGIDRAVLAAGGSSNLGQRLRNLRGEVAAVGTRAGEPLFDGKIKIANLLRDTDVSLELFSTFVHAKHAVERAARHAGRIMVGTASVPEGDVTRFDVTYGGRRFVGEKGATEFMQSLSPVKRAALDAAASVYYNMHQYVLGEAVRSGTLSREEAEADGLRRPDGTFASGAYQFYASLVGGAGRTPGQYVVTGNSRSPVAKVFEQSYAQLESRLKWAIHNRLVQDMVEVFKQYPDPSVYRLDSEYASIKKKDGDITLQWRPEDFKSENSLVGYYDGKRVRVTFVDENGKRFASEYGAQPGGALFAVSLLTRSLGAVRTTFSVPFQMVAPVWDVLLASGRMQAAAGGMLDYEQSKAATVRLWQNLAKSVPGLWQQATQSRTDDYYLQTMNRYGGGVSPGERADVSSVVASMRRVDPALGEDLSVLDKGKYLLGRASDYTHITESLTRVAAFRAFIEEKAGRGLNTQAELDAWRQAHPQEFEQALEVSRTITADFSDKGTGFALRALFMFFNPAMQGGRAVMSMAATEQGRLAIGAALATGVLAAMLGTGGDDEERQKYFRLTGRNRQIQFGEGVGIPLTPELRPFYLLGNNLIGLLDGSQTPGRAAMEIVSSAFGVMSPVDPKIGEESSVVGMALAPPIAQLPLITLFGIDPFGRDTETDKRNTYAYDPTTGERLGRIDRPADYERGRTRDPQWVKDTARWMFDTVGVDMSPGRATEVLRYALGSIYSFAEQVADPARGVGYAAGRGWLNEYDGLAAKREFEDAASEIVQAERSLARRDLLNDDPLVSREAKLVNRTIKEVRGMRLAGQSETDLYNARRAALATGDDVMLAHTEAALDALQAQKAQKYEDVLRKLDVEN